MFLYCKA